MRPIAHILLLSAGLASAAFASAGKDDAPAATRAEDRAIEQAIALEDRFWNDVEPLLAQHCFSCHGEENTKGFVQFDHILTLEDALAMGDDLQTAARLIAGHEMPPEGEPPVPEADRQTLERWIADALDYNPTGAVDPGWFTIHRLNRTEYRNTLRDLLGIDPAEHDLAAALPPDDTGYGFDNIAAVLSMSTLQLEAYLDAAERAIDLALGPIAHASAEHVPLRNPFITRGGQQDGRGYFLYSNGDVVADTTIPVTATYEIRVEAWAQQGGDQPARLAVRVDDDRVETFDVHAERSEPGTYTATVRIERGRRLIGGGFINDFHNPGVEDRNLIITRVSLAGPITEASIERPPAHQTILGDTEPIDSGEQRAHAAQVLATFAARAFRRPPTPAETASLLDLYDAARDQGDTHEQATRLGLTATLVSPAFIYRAVDNPQPNDPTYIHQLTGHELASRLSYLLWSSAPDDELLTLAESGELTQPDTLRAQTTRMLEDPKSDAFVENFAGQWLLLRNLDRLAIDQKRYPAYSATLREAMITEATMLFDEAVREHRPIAILIDSDHTYVNKPLAALYGFAELAEEQDAAAFRRVAIPEDSPRGGVLTTAAVLTVTSNPTRTSPVKRGYYVLDQLLGTPPPPPPPDIPGLEQAAATLGENPSLRQQLAAHLTNPNCAACHRRMDPIGLAMENFDAIGRWRDTDESGPIDASGTLPGGVDFSGPVQLKQILLAQQGLFADNLTRKLMTYALGRGLEPFDRPTVRRVLDESLNDQGERTVPSILHAIVQSDAFRSCRAPEPRTASRSNP